MSVTPLKIQTPVAYNIDFGFFHNTAVVQV